MKKSYLIMFFSFVLLYIITPSKVNAEWVSMYQNSMNCGNTGSISTCGVVAGAFNDNFSLSVSSGATGGTLARRFYYSTPITFTTGLYDYMLFTYYFNYPYRDAIITYNQTTNNNEQFDYGYSFYASIDPSGSNCFVLDTQSGSTYKYFNILCPISNGVSQINSIYIRGAINYLNESNGTATLTFNHGVAGLMQFHKSDGSSLQGILSSTQETTQAIEDTTQAIESIEDSLTDSSTTTNTENQNNINSWENMTASNNTISSLITMPITLFQSILNSIGGTCSGFQLGNLLGTNVTFPCINPADFLGSTLWNIIDVITSGFFIYYMSKRFISIFENFSSMKDGNDEVGD